MSILARLMARLLTQSGSLVAAAKAGHKTTVSLRVYRAAEDKWYDAGSHTGQSQSCEPVIEELIKKGTPVRVRYRAGGKIIKEEEIG